MLKECYKHGPQEYVVYGKEKSNGKPKYRCPLCARGHVNKHRADYKKKAVEYAGGKCQKCGYFKYTGALQFHHLDSTKKDFELSMRKMGISWEKITKEIDKCILLCANCHAETHAGMV